MTRFPFSISRLPLLCAATGWVLFASGCSAFRSDSSDDKSRIYVTPIVDTLDEAPPIPYSEVYVPVDAHAYQNDGKKLPLSATLVLRNPNRGASLVVKQVDLYGQNGKRIRRIAQEPFELRPFASVEFLASPETNERVRPGASKDEVLDLDVDPRNVSSPSHFIVQWGTTENAKAPLVETVMVDDKGQILYARPGHEIRQIPVDRPASPRPSVQRMDLPTQSPAYANVAPKYELIRYDSNMGLNPKDP